MLISEALSPAWTGLAGGSWCVLMKSPARRRTVPSPFTTHASHQRDAWARAQGPLCVGPVGPLRIRGAEVTSARTRARSATCQTQLADVQGCCSCSRCCGTPTRRPAGCARSACCMRTVGSPVNRRFSADTRQFPCFNASTWLRVTPLSRTGWASAHWKDAL
jgi:hypothetical protein